MSLVKRESRLTPMISPLSNSPSSTSSSNRAPAQYISNHRDEHTIDHGLSIKKVSPTPLYISNNNGRTSRSLSNGGVPASVKPGAPSVVVNQGSIRPPPLSLHTLGNQTTQSTTLPHNPSNKPTKSFDDSTTLPPETPRFVNVDQYFNFSLFIQDDEACSVFMEFLIKKRNEENLRFLMDLKQFKQLDSVYSSTSMDCLQKIKNDYLMNGSNHELNVSKNAKVISLERIEKIFSGCITSSVTVGSLPRNSASPYGSPRSLSSTTLVSSSSGFSSSPTLSSLLLNNSMSLSSSLLVSSNGDSPSSACSYGNLSASMSSSPREEMELTNLNLLKEVELEVRLQLQNESFKEFKTSDEFEHFVLTKVIEQSQNNNPVNTSHIASPTITIQNGSLSQSPNQSGGFLSRLFKKKEKPDTASPTDEDSSYDSSDDSSNSRSSTSDESDMNFLDSKPLRKWTTQQTISFFKYRLELPEYIDVIKKNDIKGLDIRILKKEDEETNEINQAEQQKKVDQLFKKLKMIKLGHKKKLQREVNETINQYYKKQNKVNNPVTLPLKSIERQKSTLSRQNSLSSFDHVSKPNTALIDESLRMETLIIKLSMTPINEKRVFTVKRGIKLERLKSTIIKEINDVLEKKNIDVASFFETRVIRTFPQGEPLQTNEKLNQYLTLASSNSQFASMRIEI